MADTKNMETSTTAPPVVAVAASVIEPSNSGCLDDPNFATICSFMEKFGETCRIDSFPFADLQEMIENTTDVAVPLVRLHISLLRRVFKSIQADKWERSLAKYGHTYCAQDGWEIERFGYKKAKIQTKLRLLKNLLESQFDYNVKFKAEVNKIPATDLRLIPLGRDTEGQLYWYQVDNDANLRVYREDVDDETWEIVASSREEMVELISQLQKGEVKKPIVPDDEVVAEEDSNGKEIEPKEILLDTGKLEDEELSEDEVDEEPDWKEDDLSFDEEGMEIDEDYVAPDVVVDITVNSDSAIDANNGLSNNGDNFRSKKEKVDISIKNNDLEIREFESYRTVTKTTTDKEKLNKIASKVEPLRLKREKIFTEDFKEPPVQDVSEVKVDKHTISSINIDKSDSREEIFIKEENAEVLNSNEVKVNKVEPPHLADDNIQNMKPEHVPVTKNETTSSSPRRIQSFESEIEQPLLLSSGNIAPTNDINTEPISSKEALTLSPKQEILNSNALIVTAHDNLQGLSHEKSEDIVSFEANTVKIISESDTIADVSVSETQNTAELLPVSVELSISITEAPSVIPIEKITKIVENLSSSDIKALPESVQSLLPASLTSKADDKKNVTEEIEVKISISEITEPTIFCAINSPGFVSNYNDQYSSNSQTTSQIDLEKPTAKAEPSSPIKPNDLPLETVKVLDSLSDSSNEMIGPNVDAEEIDSSEDEMEICEDIVSSEVVLKESYPKNKDSSICPDLQEEKGSTGIIDLKISSEERTPVVSLSSSSGVVNEVVVNKSGLVTSEIIEPARTNLPFNYRNLHAVPKDKNLIKDSSDMKMELDEECKQNISEEQSVSKFETFIPVQTYVTSEATAVVYSSTCSELVGSYRDVKYQNDLLATNRDRLYSPEYLPKISQQSLPDSVLNKTSAIEINTPLDNTRPVDVATRDILPTEIFSSDKLEIQHKHREELPHNLHIPNIFQGTVDSAKEVHLDTVESPKKNNFPNYGYTNIQPDGTDISKHLKENMSSLNLTTTAEISSVTPVFDSLVPHQILVTENQNLPKSFYVPVGSSKDGGDHLKADVSHSLDKSISNDVILENVNANKTMPSTSETTEVIAKDSAVEGVCPSSNGTVENLGIVSYPEVKACEIPRCSDLDSLDTPSDASLENLNTSSDSTLGSIDICKTSISGSIAAARDLSLEYVSIPQDLAVKDANASNDSFLKKISESSTLEIVPKKMKIEIEKASVPKVNTKESILKSRTLSSDDIPNKITVEIEKDIPEGHKYHSDVNVEKQVVSNIEAPMEISSGNVFGDKLSSDPNISSGDADIKDISLDIASSSHVRQTITEIAPVSNDETCFQNNKPSPNDLSVTNEVSSDISKSVNAVSIPEKTSLENTDNVIDSKTDKIEPVNERNSPNNAENRKPLEKISIPNPSAVLDKVNLADNVPLPTGGTDSAKGLSSPSSIEKLENHDISSGMDKDSQNTSADEILEADVNKSQNEEHISPSIAAESAHSSSTAPSKNVGEALSSLAVLSSDSKSSKDESILEPAPLPKSDQSMLSTPEADLALPPSESVTNCKDLVTVTEKPNKDQKLAAEIVHPDSETVMIQQPAFNPPLTTEVTFTKSNDISTGANEEKLSRKSETRTPEDFDLQMNKTAGGYDTTEPQETAIVKPVLGGLVGYEYSSSEEEPDSAVQLISKETLKRKAEDPLESIPKVPKIGENNPPSVPFNPIVGETIEEEIMTIQGEGSGAPNEGGNNEEEANESITQEEVPPVPAKRGRGRPKKNKSANPSTPDTPTTPKVTPISVEKNIKDHTPKTPSSTPRVRKRELENLNISFDGSSEMNGGDSINDRPVRASRRIAQIRQKEEEERRKLEEEKLAQLKAAQIRKQQKLLDKKKAQLSDSENVKLKSKKLAGKNKEYLPSPESESDSEEVEGEDGDDYEQPSKLKKKRKKRSKNGKAKRSGIPWGTSSSEDDEAVEEEEEYHYEEEEEELVFNKSDHEFSPESDLGEEDDASPSRHARTAKRGEEIVDKYAETYCDKCGKGDHPEWILLCDKCDKGWHASCIRPQLWVIPEGQWFCPPCQHNTLIEKLNENLIEYEKLLKRRENEVLRKQRLAYVGISLDNVLPGGAPILEKEESENYIEKTEKQDRQERYNQRERKSRRRRIDSDDDEDDLRGDDFINDDDSDRDSKYNSSAEESDEPMYKLRARKATKSFNFQEYDDMINSALRADDDVEVDGLEAPEVEKKQEPSNGKGKRMGDEEDSEEYESEGPNPNVKLDENGFSKVRKRILANAKRTSSDEPGGKRMLDEDTDEEELDEKEKNRRKELTKLSQRKTKRRLNDLDAPSDEDEDSDEDFKGSGGEDDDDDEEEAIEDDSEWSGDRDADESDDSIQRGARNKKGRLGRREKYLEVGSVRRSTRRRKARISYDESDQDEDEEGSDKWQSGETEESESNSESEDETWGKKKKRKTFNPPKSKFFQNPFQTKPKTKKKKKKVDDDDVDRAWNNSQSSKAKKLAEEPVERRTRGRKINFKDILDSGESDDDGNIRPKRRRILSDSDSDSDAPTSSRKLIEEIKAQNAREAAMHAAKSILSDEKQQLEEKHAAAAASAVVLPVPKNVSPPLTVIATKTSLVPPPLQSDSSATSSKGRSRSNSPSEKLSQVDIEMAMAKPVPAPPFPPSLAKALGRKSAPSPVNLTLFSSTLDNNINLLPPLGQPLAAHPPVSLSSSPTHPLQLSHSPSNSPSSLSLSLPLSSPSSQTPARGSKKSSSISVPTHPKGSLSLPPGALTPPKPPLSPHQQQALPQGVRANLPADIARLGNPGALYPSNPALRSFHAAWRGSVPPQYGNPGAGMPTSSIGKPPPLSGPPFNISQQVPPSRPGYPSPPPLRIPNPGNSPLQAFQQFKRDPLPPGMSMYRMSPPPQQGGPLPGILPPNMAALNQGPPDRYFGGPPVPGGPPYGHPPYGLPPPHSQNQPPSIFPPFDYRIQHLQRPSEPFKEEPSPTQPPPVSEPSSPPPASAATNTTKEEPPASQGDGEFGGLVSYFSSQRSNEEDLDT